MQATMNQIPRLIAHRALFKGNSMWADYANPRNYRGRLADPMALPDVETYVVYSYRTPIAWVDLDTEELIIPEVKYSVTTSRHQTACRHSKHL